jgi:hypothetical protein
MFAAVACFVKYMNLKIEADNPLKLAEPSDV